jgi:hypothetical protein
MAKATKAKLLRKRSRAMRDVELEGTGTVTVQGLRRGEVKEIRIAATKGGKVNPDLVDLYTLSRALVEPALTPDEVAQWAEQAPAGEVAKVLEACGELSGMLEGADKSGLS